MQRLTGKKDKHVHASSVTFPDYFHNKIHIRAPNCILGGFLLLLLLICQSGTVSALLLQLLELLLIHNFSVKNSIFKINSPTKNKMRL